tara:strand:+ start:2505 stop:2729 length:225 start_codon:yes stop_codon:yes gene_type:complete
MLTETFIIFSTSSITSVVNYLIFNHLYNKKNNDSVITNKQNNLKIEQDKVYQEQKLKRLKDNDDLIKLLDNGDF